MATEKHFAPDGTAGGPVDLETTMLQKRQLRIGSFLLVLALSACAGKTTSPASPAKVELPASSVNFVKAIASEAQISAGGSADAIVRVVVESGYHVNANPPTEPYLKATALTVTAGDGFSVGFITYPNATIKKFSFADKPLAVYEGEVPIKVRLKADAKATRGPHTLAATLSVQACDTQVCYPPGRLELSLPVAVK